MSPYASLDPMALILSRRAYLAYIELKQPHVPATEAVGQVMRGMSADELRSALLCARRLSDYGDAVQLIAGGYGARDAA